MARFRTTKVQISGYKLGARRFEEAVIRRDTRLLDSPFASQVTAWSYGLIITALICVAGLVVGFFKPDAGVNGQTYVVTKSGGQYLEYNGAWHPVTNSVSASLITGQPVSTNKAVNDDSLKSVNMGLPMGIASAPTQINANEATATPISVCSTYIAPNPLDEKNQTVIETSVIMGNELDKGTKITEDKAVLVTVYDKSRYWLLFNGKRAALDMDNDVVLAALNISAEVEEKALVVSPKLLDAIPAAPTITVPALANMKTSSAKVTGFRVGTILTQEMPNEPSTFYVVANDGLQMIPETVARILTTNGSSIERNPSAAIIASSPQVNPINLDYYPTKLPDYSQNNNTACATWSKPSATAAGAVTLKTSDDLPVSSKARKDMAPTISGGDGPSTDRFYTGKEGKGWYVRATDLNDESITEGTLYYISPDGIRYPIGGDDNGMITETTAALGLPETTFMLPWQYLTLIPEGATLSKKNALVLHETITPPEDQIAPTTETDKS